MAQSTIGENEGILLHLDASINAILPTEAMMILIGNITKQLQEAMGQIPNTTAVVDGIPMVFYEIIKLIVKMKGVFPPLPVPRYGQISSHFVSMPTYFQIPIDIDGNLALFIVLIDCDIIAPVCITGAHLTQFTFPSTSMGMSSNILLFCLYSTSTSCNSY